MYHNLTFEGREVSSQVTSTEMVGWGMSEKIRVKMYVFHTRHVFVQLVRQRYQLMKPNNRVLAGIRMKLFLSGYR